MEPEMAVVHRRRLAVAEVVHRPLAVAEFEFEHHPLVLLLRLRLVVLPAFWPRMQARKETATNCMHP
jgi:hypothetical protein